MQKTLAVLALDEKHVPILDAIYSVTDGQMKTCNKMDRIYLN